jgi:hypothetical protein
MTSTVYGSQPVQLDPEGKPESRDGPEDQSAPPEASPPEASPPEASPPEASPPEASPPEASPPEAKGGGEEKKPFFILYLSGAEYVEELRRLSVWVERLLVPVYAKEVTSNTPWCTRWREHPEAIASLHGLWLAWQNLTGPGAEATGPAQWHRDYLPSIMDALRSPSGPFSGCKPGAHRVIVKPPVEDDGFLGS